MEDRRRVMRNSDDGNSAPSVNSLHGQLPKNLRRAARSRTCAISARRCPNSATTLRKFSASPRAADEFPRFARTYCRDPKRPMGQAPSEVICDRLRHQRGLLITGREPETLKGQLGAVTEPHRTCRRRAGAIAKRHVQRKVESQAEGATALKWCGASEVSHPGPC